MDKYLVITYTPSRMGFVGPVKEIITIDETESEGDNAIEKIKERVHVPLYGGYCLIVKEEDVTKVTSRVINELA